MRIIKITMEALARLAPFKPTERPISASQLDKRSEPQFSDSSHLGYGFECQKIWKLMLQGKLKVTLTQKQPARWVRDSFYVRTPEDFEKKRLRGIDKERVQKYAEWLKHNPHNVPPVIFAKSMSNGKSYFIDGNHRLMASFLAGLETVPCYQISMDSLRRFYYTDEDGEKKRLIYRL